MTVRNRIKALLWHVSPTVPQPRTGGLLLLRETCGRPRCRGQEIATQRVTIYFLSV
jgi:hypothetical protein